ncbi:MAG: hypothetical protein FWF06_06300 [Symbiobacteriaceae bacterium]|nr:hypothetical protein [Symbiobacteriaceae bacterium]
MGGRGSASGVSDKGRLYGTEFETLLSIDNIKFLRHLTTTAATIPLETMSAGRNRVYVLVNEAGTLKSIVFYDSGGRKKRQIDLAHTHGGQRPHVHIGYEHSPDIVKLTKKDRAYVDKTRRLWILR